MNSRRKFLKQSLAGSAIVSLAGTAPQFLMGASQLAKQNDGDRILVVIQMSGGNDGLNTIIPYGDDEYAKNRFTLAIGKGQVLKIDDRIGFHPALSGFEELLQAGKLSFVQGVGYPNPNRSHFESMDLWHTAHRFSENDRLGWLGRMIDAGEISGDLPALHFGAGVQPLALRNENTPVPSIQSIDNFKLDLMTNRKIRKQLESLIHSPSESNNSLLSFVRDSAQVAVSTSRKLETIDTDQQNNEFGYPQSNLAKHLRSIGDLIGSGLSTRVYYTELGGFDTHSNQAASHQGLLSDLSNSMSAFIKQVEDQGNGQRVAVLAFSEFGRRVRENASGGTDHGTAAPVFVAGAQVRSGPINRHPSLSDLDNGDLKFTVDYRTVYAELLETWLGVDPEPVLGGKFEPVSIFDV